MKKFKVKLDDGTEVEVILASEVDAEITTLQNNVELAKNQASEKLRLENKDLKMQLADFETTKTKLTDTETKLAEALNISTKSAKQLKLTEIFGDKVPIPTLIELSELPVLRDADLSDDEKVKSTVEAFKTKFPHYFEEPAKTDPNNSATSLTKRVGSSGTKIDLSQIKSPNDLKGQSKEVINAYYEEQLKK